MSKIISLICLTLVLSSCSRMEYFVIANYSEKSLFINYEILTNDSLFGIFDMNPNIYSNSPKQIIEWNKPVKAVVNVKDSTNVEVILPPHCSMVFGTLMNDHYKNCDQEFINNTFFNLSKIEIKQKEKKITIDSSNFDSYFLPKRGTIAYTFE